MTRSVPPSGTGHSHALPEGDPRDQGLLALLGHDLRAALSDVIGGLRLIAPDTLDPATRVQFERVRASGEVLARLLEQGLAVILGEAGPPPSEVINLRRFLTDLDLRWSGRALEMGIGFDLRPTEDLPVMIRVDRVALDRVLSNLLGNAFKYAGRGQVVCEVALLAEDRLGFAVRDNGPGFPASLVGRAVPPQARPAGMAKPGSGMGLRIAADLTRAMGGRMALRNLVPTGAEARVDLPITPIDVPDAADLDDGGIAQDPFLSGKRVLIADDNATSQMILSRFTTNLGAEVVVVGDGVETVGRLERESFDLLIVDVEMPRLSGLDVIRRLRAMPGAVARMPVVAVTAYMLRANRQAVMAAGADDMLSKPLLCPHAFAAVVRDVMQGTPGATATRPGQVSTATSPAMDESRLYKLLDLAGPETGRDLLDRLLIDLSGVERGLVHAGTARDWEAIRDHTHVLISLAGAVGGVRLQHEAEALNHLAHDGDSAALGQRMHDTLTLLDLLIHFVSQVRDARGVEVR